MRTFSTAAMQSLMKQETGVVWLVLLEIDHDSLPEPIRVVNNTVDVVSNGDTYVGFPFRFKLPNDSDDTPPTATIQIDNVDRTVVQAIRSITGSPTVRVSIVTSADLDTVEMGPLEFSLKSVTYDSFVVEGQLAYEPILYEPYPAESFTPSNFPGLF